MVGNTTPHHRTQYVTTWYSTVFNYNRMKWRAALAYHGNLIKNGFDIPGDMVKG